MSLLAEDLVGAVHMRRIMHADGPRGRNGYFIDIEECIEHPRLSRQRTIMRATGEVTDLWMVDQHPAGELEDAVAVLNGDATHVPIAEQIDTIEVLLDGRALTDEERQDLTRQLNGILRTLKWSQENVAELRAFRKWKIEQKTPAHTLEKPSNE